MSERARWADVIDVVYDRTWSFLSEDRHRDDADTISAASDRSEQRVGCLVLGGALMSGWLIVFALPSRIEARALA